MTVLKAYFDESGQEGDPQHSVISVAGYLGTTEAWEIFEYKWNKALKINDVPYLHMKEFIKKRGPYAKWLGKNPDEKASFFRELVSAIKEADLYGFGMTIRLADLYRFSSETRAFLDARALGLYGSIILIHEKFPDKKIEITLDRMDNSEKTINLTKNYCISDGKFPKLKNYIENMVSISSLPKNRGFKEVIPIQAADFLAWEMRKWDTDNAEAIEHVEHAGFPDDWRWRFLEQQIAERRRKYPDQMDIQIPSTFMLGRKSFLGLVDANIVQNRWNIDSLRAAHAARKGVFWHSDV